MKYKVNCWAHVHYMVEVEANSVEEAEDIVNEGLDDTYSFVGDVDYGDGGITNITDENGNVYWCE